MCKQILENIKNRQNFVKYKEQKRIYTQITREIIKIARLFLFFCPKIWQDFKIRRTIIIKESRGDAKENDYIFRCSLFRKHMHERNYSVCCRNCDKD